MTVLDKSFDFSLLDRRELEVTAPDGKKYILREATGDTVATYRNAVMQSTITNSEGKIVGYKGSLASLESLLVSRCLWDEKGVNPTQQTVGKWPNRMQKQLFEAAKELSDMGEKEDPIKKALEKAFTTAGSPVQLDDFIVWIMGLSNEECKPLQDMFREVAQAKNLLKPTTNGSS